jgi:serine/threonine-protein kinase/endoribonuclease IRE1
VETDVDATDGDPLHQDLYVIEPQTGDIYFMASPTSPLQRLSVSMPQLVNMSPFSFSDDEGGRLFLGKKETSLLLVELETGIVQATFNSECPWNPFEDLTSKSPSDLEYDEMDDDKPPISSSTKIFIGRTGQCLSIS